MTKIIYKQEKPVKAPFVFPALIGGLGLFNIIYHYFKQDGFTAAFIDKGLFPGVIAIVFSLFVLFLVKKKMKKEVDAFQEIRAKGQVLYGTVSKVVTHTHYSTDANNHTYEKHKYSFLVTYEDPATGETVTAESIECDNDYTLKGMSCKIQVYNDQIIVDEVEAEAVPGPKKWPVILIFAIIFILIVYIFTR